MFDDMTAQLDKVAVRPAFVGRGHRLRGRRSVFGSQAAVSRYLIYSPEWADGEPCRTIEALVANAGPATAVDLGKCLCSTGGPSVFMAQPVNVWDYMLITQAGTPDEFDEARRGQDCSRARRRFGQMGIPGSRGFYCVPEVHACVAVTIMCEVREAATSIEEPLASMRGRGPSSVRKGRTSVGSANSNADRYIGTTHFRCDEGSGIVAARQIE